ncbi:MAG: hypothetical protein LBJ63_06985 [Prevotellaceae bacterium]|jgi:uncharacterized protein (TIGR02145 family)|nr:hypothetical protein [Prevotellaceae bacterium]
MKKIIVLLSLAFAFNCMQAQQPQGMVTLLGYLHVYPEDLGDFTYEPVNIINAINSQAKYGYNDWRLPTVEEIELMIANKSKIPAFQEGKFMTKDGKLRSGNVRLVTTGKTVAEKEKQRKIEEERAEQRRMAEAKRAEAVNINGVWWATRNVGSRGIFVPKPEDYGGYYTWNEAQIACPAGWRLPTLQEFESLINSGSHWITVNGKNGRRFGSGIDMVFLPAAGVWPEDGLNGLAQYINQEGKYWSSERPQDYQFTILFLYETKCFLYAPFSDTRYSVRCVAE